MVQALSVAPGALQNYMASPAVGLYLPPKNPLPWFPFVFKARLQKSALSLCPFEGIFLVLWMAIHVPSFISWWRFEVISGKRQTSLVSL